jgi:DNA (cytosine-5)-methyltransferase 1
VEVFLDFVAHLRPPYVLMENVPGMLSLNQGRVPQLLQESLEGIGYHSRIGILQAGYYGLPQNRWRVFIWAATQGHPLPPFPEPTHCFPRTTIFGARSFRQFVVMPPAGTRDLFWHPLNAVTVEDAISDLPEIPNGGGLDQIEYGSPPRSDYQRAMRSVPSPLWDHCCPQLSEIMHQRCRAVPKREGAGWLDLPQHLKPKNLLRHGDERYPNRFGRLHWSGNFNTILSRPHPYWGRVFHPAQDRVISVRESARAQGFSDSVRFFGGLSARYMQVGNAVPPPLARSLAAQLVKVVAGQSRKRDS